MTKAFLILAFLASVFVWPWWATLLLLIIYLSEEENALRAASVAMLGGALLDACFGAPITALHGFAYLYTMLFTLLALLSVSLRTRILE